MSVFSFSLLLGCSSGELGADWSDDAGNAENQWEGAEQSDMIAPDLVGVKVTPADRKLVFELNTPKGNLATSLKRKKGDPPMPFGFTLAKFYSDLDNNPATGKQLDRKDHEDGFEVTLAMMTGFQWQDKSGSSRRALGYIDVSTESTQLDPIAGFMVMGKHANGMDLGWDQLGFDAQDEENAKCFVLGADEVVINIAYQWLNLKSGDEIRLMYEDWTYQDWGKAVGALSEVRRLKLK